MLKKVVLMTLLTAIVSAGPMLLMGCNTTEGMGKDMKNAGHGIENAADRNK